MSLQESTFNTTHVMDNEIVKANDFEFAFENLIENVSKSTQMMLESNQDFVINGKVVPYTGMNVKVSPIYGVCKSTGIPFGRTELSESIGFEESTAGRVDIIEVKGEWETYDNQQRAFNDPDTDIQTYQYVDTKKLMKPVYKVKQGTEGSSTAPDVDTGYVKLAEVVIRANNSTIQATDIKNITADIAGLDNEDWTAQQDITYNIGYISDVNARFRVQHEADGTHSENCINSDSLDIGIGSKQINSNILPVGGTVSIPTQTIAATDSILSVITKAALMITSLYNAYLKFGNYNFNGELSVSSIADANNALTNPLKLVAAGDGTAVLKIGNSAVLSIDANGKLSTNGYTATSNNHIVTKAVTDAITTALNNLSTRVENIEENIDNTVYTNGVLSSGTGGRFNVDSTNIYVATTQNITLSGSQSIDGQTLTDGVYVLVKNQTDAKQNGIYQYSSNSTWSRVSTFIKPNQLKGKIFTVSNGTANKGKMFYTPKVNFNPSNPDGAGESFGYDDINFLEYFASVSALGNKVAIRDSNGFIDAAVTSAGKLTMARKVYVKLGTASTSETKDFSGDTAIPVNGTLAIANGGTGTTTQENINKNIVAALEVGDADVTDGTQFITSYASDEGYSKSGNYTNKSYKRKFISVFNYMKSKFGTAAQKTAGRTAGNVPLVGTTLSNTDNTIVVTDTSGALKSSSYTIGSAASKTAGSAAGNVPLVGTALGSTNNNIVVTDTTGKLKTSGIVIGSAAGKDTGYDSGEVPIIGSELHEGKIVYANNDQELVTSTYGVDDLITYTSKIGNASYICNTAETETNKIVNAPGFTLYQGVTVRVLFTKAHKQEYVTLNINNTGNKGISYFTRNRTLTSLTYRSGKWRNSDLTSYETWQENTILELMYDGNNHWIIIGNPVLESYYYRFDGYKVYADGLVEQWGLHDNGSAYYTGTINYPIPFDAETPTGYNAYNIQATIMYQSDGAFSPCCVKYQLGPSSCTWQIRDSSARYINWRAIGY